jgi:agmatine deiminase
LTTTSCLLNENRNPDLSQEEIEGYLRACLGVSNILWLGKGIAGDDTDGHIDDLSRFVNPTTVIAVVEEDPADENYEILQENLRLLRTTHDQDNRPLEVVPMPMPAPIFYGGERLPASYANFYIANGVVLVPTFNDPHDAQALTILQELFPSRRVVGIDCTDLIWGLGAIHCVTQQEPGE